MTRVKTDDLIRALAADPRPGPSLEAGLAGALVAGLVGATALFALTLNVRPGLAGLVMEPRIALKFAVALAMAASAGALALRLARPGARRPSWAVILLPLALALFGCAGEMLATPERTWMPGLIGRFAPYCLAFVPLLSLPVLGAALVALRRGAPARPVEAGAAAGFLAGGLGAAVYAFHCPDDSAFFVLTWYGLAILAVAGLGALLGGRLLRW